MNEAWKTFAVLVGALGVIWVLAKILDQGFNAPALSASGCGCPTNGGGKGIRLRHGRRGVCFRLNNDTHKRVM